VPDRARPTRGRLGPFLFFAAFLYLLFVIYGSLVPLRPVPIPFDEAWHRFQSIQTLRLGILARADWVANLLLMVPLAFLWLAALATGRGAVARGVWSGVVWSACIGLALAIEFTQLYFPQRTVSVNDIVAEGIGAGIGVAAWWFLGSRVARWLVRWQETRGVPNLAEQAVWAYAGLLVLYNLMPLDLAPSPWNLLEKFRAGRLVLVPFGFETGDLPARLYEVASGIAIWAPLAALWVLSGRKSAVQSWIMTTGIAAGIEFAQLFVYTRVSDVTDVLIAAAGAGIGAWGTARIARRGEALTAPAGATPVRWLASGLALGIVWLAVLAVVFWYPFEVRMERAFVLSRVDLLRKVPFQSYYDTSEFMALTQAFRHALFLVPWGGALGLVGIPLRGSRWKWAYHVFAVCAAILVPAAIELGQLAMPGKYPDSTDLAIEAAGAIAGYVAVWIVVARLKPSSSEPSGKGA
jgi:VanZ family protein